MSQNQVENLELQNQNLMADYQETLIKCNLCEKNNQIEELYIETNEENEQAESDDKPANLDIKRIIFSINEIMLS